MFNGLHNTDAMLATQTLEEERMRFPSFSSTDAVTLGLSIRKRFRSSTRHAKGQGLLISVESIAGHRLFCTTVGDLGHSSGIGDVSLASWTALDAAISVVKQTGHSSYYVEKGFSALGRVPRLSLNDDFRVQGGAFPIWLENGHCCPIAVVACYSGSSQDDHHLVVTTVRDYLNKLRRNSEAASLGPTIPVPSVLGLDTHRDSSEWQHEEGRRERTPSPVYEREVLQ